MAGVNWLFFQLPPAMRPSYLKNAADHFYQRPNLFRVLKQCFREPEDFKIWQAIQESLACDIIRDILDKQNLINGALSKWKMIFLRSFIRLAKPETIVETGVAHGSSSAVILDALQKNQKGSLYSVDLPLVVDRDDQKASLTTVQSLNQVGWLVSDSLRARWSLTLGDSLTELPKIIRNLPPLDIFLHDSLHSYEHMMKEFRMIWPHLTKNGFLLSDDIFVGKHAAIYDFAKGECQPFKTFLQMGIICNEQSLD